jgi:hypothetical protein
VETDGHQMVIVTMPKTEASAFPELTGAPIPTNTFEPFVMGAPDAIRIAKLLPLKSTIPVLQHAAICTGATSETGARTVPVLTTDLSSSQTHSVRALDGNFPDYKRVMPKLEETTFKVGFDAKKMKALMAQFESFMKNKTGPLLVDFYFTAENSAVRMEASGGDDQQMTAILMPVRSNFAAYAPIEAARLAEAEAAKELTGAPEETEVAA